MHLSLMFHEYLTNHCDIQCIHTDNAHSLRLSTTHFFMSNMILTLMSVHCMYTYTFAHVYLGGEEGGSLGHFICIRIVPRQSQTVYT